MQGYIMPDKPDLKIKEFELYSGYYCGICKSIAARYGQLPRLVLSYDSVLLALLLAGIDPNTEQIKIERCMVHPLKKRTIVYNSPEIDFAADILLILAYFKLLDDYQDDKNKKAAVGALLLKNVFNRLKTTKTEKCRVVQEKLDELSNLEQEKCPSLDRAAEPFAKLMEEVFDPEDDFNHKRLYNEETSMLYRRIGYHLGKWIYLIDAFDDIEENSKSGSYNPLIYQFGYNDGEGETVEEFRARIADRVEMNLMCYLAEVSACCEKLLLKKNKGLIDNIIYFGLRRKTEEILKKGSSTNAESI